MRLVSRHKFIEAARNPKKIIEILYTLTFI